MSEDLLNGENQTKAGFRLQYLEVLNWGTFDKARWQIQPNGQNALLTGDIGSGKSTLVDALTCLLVPVNKITFNKAAGAEGKERSLLSYVRGEYKKEKEEITKVAKKIYLRPGDNTYSVITANFHNEGYGEDISLAQVFWIGKEGKVDKLLIIGTIPLSIAKHFSGFTDVNDLRKRLRNSLGIELFNDNFSQYSEQFRRLFGMNSDKAIDLFYQTVSMKSVSSLTTFVREQMLERTDVKEQITALLSRFDDLTKAHAAVVNAREQYQILSPLVAAAVEYETNLREIEEIEAMLNVVPAWFAQQKQGLLKDALQQQQEKLGKALALQKQLAYQLNELEDKKIGLLQDIENNGGKRVGQIDQEIRQHDIDKAKKKDEHEQYEKLAASCGLSGAASEQDFEKNIIEAKNSSETLMARKVLLGQERDVIVSELRKLKTDLAAELQELTSLKERKTQIPAWLIGFRLQLCNDLRIDEEDLPFAGELLKVNEYEMEWEGAVEKLLHDTGISMLVPGQHYRGVSKYINDNPLRGADGRGIKLTYLEANFDHTKVLNKQLDNDSIAYKLDILPDSPFHDWLENYIQRVFGDYICADLNDLAQYPHAVTKQGLIKSGRIKHTKDDRKRIGDRRHYVLGWSNEDKIRLLEDTVAELDSAVFKHQDKQEKVEAELTNNEVQQQALAIFINTTNYERINWQYHVEKIHQLEAERYELLNNNDMLALLHQQKDEVLTAIISIKNKETENNQDIGKIQTTSQNYEQQLKDAEYELTQVSHQQIEQHFPKIAQRMGENTLRLSTIDKEREQFKRLFEGENGELRKLRHRLGMQRSTVERKMREIKEHSKVEYSEISESIEARAEYISKHEKLKTEDLKRHENRFKEELNRNTIHSIATFDSKLQKHENDIRQKIKLINEHLSEIVYDPVKNTYIIMLIDPTVNKEVRLFREELKKCYMHSFSSSGDLYTEEKYEQVKQILDRFASGDSSDREWTNTVTDVRQWFEFNASERRIEDDVEQELYEGSGGKSGGQKEKLAYTILASALAYQFGLQFGERKSRSFRFVVIDEAFGRGSDESTKYGLELFKKLDLQLLIVTPLQKIHIIEGHVNSFHFISNREGNNSQVSNFTKAEYHQEKARFNGAFQENGVKI